MLNMKKALIVGSVLTAFCANAFAAAAEEQQAPQPTMKEKVAAILNNYTQNPNKVQKPKLTPEQKAEKQRLKAEKKRLKKEWKNMTPEQRQQAKEKFRKEREEARAKYAQKTMSKLTDEQKAEVQNFIKEDMAQRAARKAKLDKMTPEQREAVRANMPKPPKPPKADKEFGKHHKGEFRGYGPHNVPHHPGEFPPPAPQAAQD